MIMEVQEIIDILSKFKEGETIQINRVVRTPIEGGECVHVSDRWEDLDSNLYSILAAVYHGHFVRVKPEPHYRPYKNADEFVKASIKHKDLMRSKTADDHPLKTKYLRPCNITDEEVWGVNCGDALFDYRSLLSMFVWNDDGSPCGVAEEE